MVKTAIKVADFSLRKNHNNKISINYLPDLGPDILCDNRARIYLITENKIIKKIGGSASIGGIKATMSFYIGAMTGSPGVPRFIIHLLIERALLQNSKVELYMITSPKTLAEISGLFGTKEVEIASFKEMENLCKSDYFEKEGRFPEWNFQENNEPYPNDLAKRHVEYHQKRLNGKNSKS